MGSTAEAQPLANSAPPLRHTARSLTDQAAKAPKMTGIAHAGGAFDLRDSKASSPEAAIGVIASVTPARKYQSRQISESRLECLDDFPDHAERIRER